MMAWGYDEDYPAYVPVAERRRIAARKLDAMRKQGLKPQPVQVEGRTIARTVWGQAWCRHLEGYADMANRLERGRTYVRNGSVIHLEVTPGRVKALVSGTEVYETEATVQPLPAPRWKALVAKCTGQVASVVELLSGRLSQPVMDVLCDREKGLFPAPKEIAFRCSCPDAASMCKHVAAVLYGVGTRLDTAPEMLFTLRKVDASQLVARAATGLTRKPPAPKAALKLEGESLAGLFGIELAGATPAQEEAPKAPVRTAAKVRKVARKAAAKTARKGLKRPASTRAKAARKGGGRNRKQ